MDSFIGVIVELLCLPWGIGFFLPSSHWLCRKLDTGIRGPYILSLSVGYWYLKTGAFIVSTLAIAGCGLCAYDIYKWVKK